MAFPVGKKSRPVGKVRLTGVSSDPILQPVSKEALSIERISSCELLLRRVMNIPPIASPQAAIEKQSISAPLKNNSRSLSRIAKIKIMKANEIKIIISDWQSDHEKRQLIRWLQNTMPVILQGRQPASEKIYLKVTRQMISFCIN